MPSGQADACKGILTFFLFLVLSHPLFFFLNISGEPRCYGMKQSHPQHLASLHCTGLKMFG